MDSTKVNSPIISATTSELESPFSSEIASNPEAVDYSFSQTFTPNRASAFGSGLAAFPNPTAFLTSRSK